MKFPILKTLAVVAALPFSVAAQAGTLSGEALYRERLALPPNAVFEAVLLDAAWADVAAAVLGRARIEPAGAPPFRFEIDYDDAALSSRGRYVVRATVTLDGRLLFTTDRIYPAFDDKKPLRLLLRGVGGRR